MSEAATPTPSEARQVALPELTPELMHRCGMAAAKLMLTGCEDGAPLRAALEVYREEAARSLRQAGEAWQPIATAPKDGSTFLVYLPGERRKVQTAWQNENGVMAVGACFAFDLTPATHWQPLPTPPAQEHPND